MTQPGTNVAGLPIGPLGQFRIGFAEEGDPSGLGASAIAAVQQSLFQIGNIGSSPFISSAPPSSGLFDFFRNLALGILPAFFLPEPRRSPAPGPTRPEVEFPGGFPLPFPFPQDPSSTPQVGEGGFIIETGTDIGELPRDPAIPQVVIEQPFKIPPFIPIIIPRLPRDERVPRSEPTGEAMPEFFGTGPGLDIGDIFDIGGRILGDVNVPFGGFQFGMGGQALNLVSGGANGGTRQVANGACPPARARMPSSIMADDPCSPTNPTIYIKAGKASAALWPAVIRSQARRLSGANKSIPKKIVRRKKK